MSSDRQKINQRYYNWKLIIDALTLCQFQNSEADFLGKDSLRILNSGKIL